MLGCGAHAADMKKCTMSAVSAKALLLASAAFLALVFSAQHCGGCYLQAWIVSDPLAPRRSLCTHICHCHTACKLLATVRVPRALCRVSDLQWRRTWLTLPLARFLRMLRRVPTNYCGGCQGAGHIEPILVFL